MKFLVIRFSSIGDIVLTTPVVRCLKKQIVTAEVHYLTKRSLAPVISSNPFVDRFHYLDNSLDDVIELLRSEDYDYIIDLHHNLRSLKVKRGLRKQSFSFNKLNIRKWIYVNLKWNVMPDVHIVDRYMATLQSFGVKNDGRGLDYFLPKEDYVRESDIPASHHAGYVALVIGGAHNTKKYPTDKHQQLCAALEHPVIIVGGPEDRPAGEQISSIDRVKIYNACGKFNINESADLVRRSRLVITNDTGMMHIAAAFGKPVISLWGNTVPAFGMTPYYPATRHPDDYRLEVHGLPCRPCSKIGYQKCPRGHFKCMRLIDPMRVMEMARQVMMKSRDGSTKRNTGLAP